jgi:Zn-dependent peptidase ImmA (M78 family)
MSRTNDLLAAARCAAQVLLDQKVKERIAAGYTRVDPVRIADEAEVAVMFQPMDKLLGAYLKSERPGIIVNVSRPVGLIHMTCAHELGHHFLGHSATADTEVESGFRANPLEAQADAFAYGLLAPQWLIKSVMMRKRWTASHLKDPAIIYQLSLRLGTSYKSALWTLVRARVISSAEATQLSGRGPKELKEALLQSHSLENWTADVWKLDQYDRDLIIEPHPDDQFVVDLPNHAGAGFSWSVDGAKSEGFHVEPILHSINSTPLPNFRLGPDELVGSANELRVIVSIIDTQRIHTQPSSPLALVESQPWLGIVDGANRFETATEYELLRKGVSPAEKLRLKAEADDSQ